MLIGCVIGILCAAQPLYGQPDLQRLAEAVQLLRQPQSANQGTTKAGRKPLTERTKVVERRVSSEDLKAKVEAALAKPSESLKPNVVFFPVVDPQGQLHPRCLGFSYAAGSACIYGRQRRIDASLIHQWNLFRSVSWTSSATRFNAEMIDRCCADAEAKLYVLPTLDTAKTPWRLKLEFHGDGVDFPDALAEHDIAATELSALPGLIARFTLDALEVSVSVEEAKQLAELGLPLRGDEVVLGQIHAGQFVADNTQAIVAGIVRRHPQSLAAWQAFFDYSWDDEQSVEFLASQLQPPKTALFDYRRVWVLLDLGRSEDVILSLLPLAPSHYGDPLYWYFLTRASMLLEENALVATLLTHWQKHLPGYVGCLGRGEILDEWGWDARGTGFASTVSSAEFRLFQTRLTRAQSELSKAVKLHPAGRQAWAAMISIDTAMGAPRPQMESHFTKALDGSPSWRSPYERKLNYLLPRWHGSERDLFHFGQECVATRYWEEGVPQLFVRVLDDLGVQLGSEGRDYSVYKSLAVWDAIKNYHQEAWRYGDRHDRHRSLIQYAAWGALGGHYDDVVVAFQRLRYGKFEGSRASPLPFLTTLVESKTGAFSGGVGTPGQLLAQAKLALAHGDPRVAERSVQMINLDEKGDADISQAALDRLQTAIDFSKRLHEQGSIAVTPQELAEIGVFGFRHHWKVEGDALVCRMPGRGGNGFHFPVGFLHGEISGDITLTGPGTWFDLRSHVNSRRQEVSVLYMKDRGVIKMGRGLFLYQEAPLPDGPIHFQIQWGAENDEVNAANGVRWTTPVHNDEPGCFAIDCGAIGQAGTLRIENLKIKITN